MPGKSMPLAAHLLFVFLGLILAATAVSTYSAYQSALESLEADARRAVRAAAHTRAQMITHALASRHERARGLLVSAESACSERLPRRRFAWAPDCLHPMVDDFRAGERAVSVQLTYRGRRVASSGVAITPAPVAPDALAAVIVGHDGRADYQTQTNHGDLTLVMRFQGNEIEALLSDHSGLRDHGEIFLTESDGRFLTAARYWTSTGKLTPPGAETIEPIATCIAGPDEIVAMDYRGLTTLHGLAPVPALGTACVDAHMDYDEALAPALALRQRLVLNGAVFVLLGALLSLIAARRIAAPVRRLALAARDLQAGRFATSIPLAGPSEVRGLGRAFEAMAADLAELVASEQSARRAAEEANTAKDKFLATVSHELRTPLTAVLGWTHLLRMGQLDNTESKRAVQAIERSGEVLRRLVEDLLDVSSVIVNRVTIVRSPTNMASVVEKALDAVRPQAADKSVRLETRCNGENLLVLGDAQRLQQVVWNLVWNAVKFTPSGGWVRVTVCRDGSTVELSVSDNGGGIPRGFLPFVFDWFRQAAPSSRGSQSGLGLGLGLVQHLVKMHDGTVRAESAGEGHGATFVVTLPAYEGKSEEKPERQPWTEHAVLKSVQVLVVDDDGETRDILRALLENAGATVRTASSAAEARDEITANEPHVLISDITMPREDGYALIRTLRASHVITPAIALTALALRGDADSAKSAGYDLHLVKPARPEDLIAAVSALSHRRSHGDRQSELRTH